MLPTVTKLVDYSADYSIDVKVIQNGHCEDSEKLLSTSYPKFKYIQSDNNYLFSYNPIVEKLDSKTIFILNDDLKLSESILEIVLPLFRDRSLFAVSCLFYDWGTKDIQLSGSTVQLNKGKMKILHQINQPASPEYCFYASGGASIYRTALFNELNGYDEIYRPAYYEDADLSHRAWHRGWTSIVHPDAWVEHRSGQSWKNTRKEKQLISLQLRNKMIGALVNNHSSMFLFYFILRFPILLLYSLIAQPIYFKSRLALLKRMPKVLQKRRINKKAQQFSNDFMLSKIGTKYQYEGK